jgi:hypothetical protein
MIDQSNLPNVKVIKGIASSSRLGYTLTTLDFNKDGYSDLVISSPGTFAQYIFYYGMVQIHFGSPAGLSLQPNITVLSDQMFTNLGSTLSSLDIDGDGWLDLIVSSPFAKSNLIESGEVWIYLSSTSRKSGQVLAKKNADWLTLGEDFFDWFGFHSTVVALKESRYLIVGAPQYNNGNTSLGKLYAFDITNFNKTRKDGLRDVSLKWTVTGVDSLGKLGFSFDFGTPAPGLSLLALSLPAKEIAADHFWQENKVQAGSVVLFSVDNLQGNYSLNQLKLYTEFDSKEEFSRLGWRVLFAKNSKGTSDLVVSEPWKDRGIWPNEGDAGALYLFKGGSNFPTGLVKDPRASADLCMLSSTGKSLYGKSMCLLDFNGDGKVDLLVGGPRDRTVNDNSGGVSLMLSFTA